MRCYGGDLVVPDKSLHELIWGKMLEYGDDVAIIDTSGDGKSITYMELYHKSRKVAAYLQSVGVKKGDFVSICARGSVEFSYLMIGIFGCGGIETPCNPSYRKTEMLHELKISSPRVVFVEEEAVEMMKSVTAEVSFIEKLIVIGNSNEFLTLCEIMNDPTIGPLQRVHVDPLDVAMAPRSSGTTGLPKCLMRSHKSFVSYYSTGLRGTGISKTRDTSQSMYTDRPLYHASGYLIILRNIVYGMRTVTAREYHLDQMFKIMEKYKPTSLTCTPPVCVDMANATNIDKYDLSSLKFITSAGAALLPAVAQRIMKKMNVSIATMYASTEAGMISAYLITEGDTSNSSGRPLEGVEVKITDIVTERECSNGCDGEIRVKTPQIMKEYYKNDAANATAFDKDGWYKTGDVGHVDEDGNVYITDRLREIIQYGTAQVSPAQLESVIISHPKVADVGVIGIPDERDGELPKAFVVPSDKSLTVEDVHKIVEDNLVEYKHLRGGVEFVTSIPKSATGKIQRKELKQMA